MKLPEDPVMLMSIVNMRLRDRYDSLDSLCRDMEIDRGGLETKLHSAGFDYVAAVNQFR